jgi:hypothetical protein
MKAHPLVRPFFVAVTVLVVALAFPAGASDATSAAPSAVGRWRQVPSPNPSDQANYLSALAPVAPNDVWAVGAWYRPSSTPGTLTEHWDGSNWSVVSSPNATGGYNELYGAAAVSSTDVWAVGYHNISAYGSEKTMALHWDGARWSIVQTRNMGPDANEFRAVAPVAANDVWAVGFGASTSGEVGRPLIEHWDGGRWSLVRAPNVGSGFGILNGVVALALDDVWAVGSHGDSTLIEHWNGRTWTVVPSPDGTRAESELYAVSASAPDDVWAVGDSYDNQGSDTLVEHWDGIEWSVVPSLDGPKPNTSLFGALAFGSGDVWAVGSMYDPVPVDYRTFTEHWDGAAWTVVPSPNPGPLYDLLVGVAGFPGGAVWAVGEAYTRTLVVRNRGA